MQKVSRTCRDLKGKGHSSPIKSAEKLCENLIVICHKIGTLEFCGYTLISQRRFGSIATPRSACGGSPQFQAGMSFVERSAKE